MRLRRIWTASSGLVPSMLVVLGFLLFGAVGSVLAVDGRVDSTVVTGSGVASILIEKVRGDSTVSERVDSTLIAELRADTTAIAGGKADSTLIAKMKADTTAIVGGKADSTLLFGGKQDSVLMRQSKTDSTLFVKMKADTSWAAKEKADSTKTVNIPRRAMLRSLVLPGWGQFYNGKKIKGGVIAAAEVGSAVAFFIKRDQLRKAGSSERNIYFFTTIGVVLYSMADAYVDAYLGQVDWAKVESEIEADGTMKLRLKFEWGKR